VTETTLQKGATRRRRVRELLVRIVDGPDAGAEARSSEPSATLGTAADTLLPLSDREVSRYHLELTPADTGVRVVDVGSTNGTFFGGVEIKEAIVPVGARLSIGGTIVEVGGIDSEVEEVDFPPPTIPSMVATSESMRRVAAETCRLAPTNVSVFVRGETGTGKEVVARALHTLGTRAGGPFVVVDCGSLPATLVASELFGHERGAFTGADRQHAGAFERANGGTLFLDEIGELPLSVQPALLGALERRSFRRVGGRGEISVDVRLVCATHRDLRGEVNRDRFRADLYYRLAVARIEIPPLRERPEDIEPLVTHFVTEITGQNTLPFGPRTLDALRAHRWSGNVRELRNVVEAAVAMGEVRLDTTRPGQGAGPEAAADVSEALAPYKEARAAVIGEFEKRYLSCLIEQCEGNASEAARRAKMDRQYLLTLLRRHGLR